MKKAILAGLLALTITAPVHGAVYPHMGEVTEVCRKANGYKVTFTDGVGCRFSWLDNSGDWFIGDFVAVIMDDNGTRETVYDDTVLDARYVGYLEMFY